MTATALAMIAAYLMCSTAAEVRLLDPTEAEACSTIYMHVKLDFLPDVDMAHYQQMSASDRAEVNRRAYAAYVAWRVANPELVDEMEADARRQLATAGL